MLIAPLVCLKARTIHDIVRSLRLGVAQKTSDCPECMLIASLIRYAEDKRFFPDETPDCPECMLIASLIRYAEDKRFFPDETPAAFDAIDDLWRSYSGNLGDVTFWGPRDRLRCRNTSISGGGGSALVVGGTAGRRRGAELPLVMPGAAVSCLEKLRAVISGGNPVSADELRATPTTSSSGVEAKVFVAVDAPRLQEAIFSLLGERAFITPGVGIDPTNEYRDRRTAHEQLKGQLVGRQDLADRNLIKVSLDYYIQGFCLSSMTLRPSAFYAAAGLRTAALKGAITSAALRNLSRAPAGLTARPKCLGEALSTLADAVAPGHADVGIDRCQRELCGVYGCNLNQ
jgi:hypothetical protein